jgi:hypothetical protein
MKMLAKIPDWQHKFFPKILYSPPPPVKCQCSPASVWLKFNRTASPPPGTSPTSGDHVIVLKGALTVIASPDGQFGIIPVATSDWLTPEPRCAGWSDHGLLARGRWLHLKRHCGRRWIHAQAGRLRCQSNGKYCIGLPVMCGESIRKSCAHANRQKPNKKIPLLLGGFLFELF